MDNSLKFHSHINRLYGKASGLANNLLCHTSCRDLDFMKTLFISHVRPLMTFSSPLWNLGYSTDLRKLENVQRRWTKSAFPLQDLPYPSRLIDLGISSIRSRLFRADLILCWKIFHRECHISPDELFIPAESSNRGHCFKIFKPRVNLDVARRFFSFRVISAWNDLPADIVSAPTLRRFKTLLHRHYGSGFFILHYD